MRRTLRWAGRLLAAAILLSGIAAAAAWALLRASLPQLDGDVAAAALRAPVTVERDTAGSVTVRAADRSDLAWAIGYVHAQERYFEMDLMRRSAAGELAALFGEAAVPLDRQARVHRMRARLAATLDRLPTGHRDALDRYRDGVNAGLRALHARPFPYLLTGTAPAPWRSEDSLLVVAAMFFDLQDAGNARELGLSRLHAALSETAYRFVTASGGGWDAPLAGPPLRWPALPTPAELDLRTLAPADPAAVAPSQETPGSNAFAVSGALAGGPALVANDMHLGLRVPNIWFRARFVYPDPRRAGRDVDVSGVSLPGMPAIVAGSNGRVAWGFTNSYGDFADWVRVSIDAADPDRYRSTDGWAPVATIRETIAVHGGADIALDVRETAWGPLLADDADGTPLALAWAAHRPGAIDLGLLALDTAETVDEAVAIAQSSGIPAQNFVVGDRAGHIAWTIAGRIPRRSGDYDASLPSDWSRPGVGWDGWIEAAQHPLIADPPWQRIWSGNQRMVESPWLDVLGDGGYDLGVRAMRIRDDLAARERFTPQDMLAIQLDDQATLLESWKNALARQLDAMAAGPDRDALRAALADWTGKADVDSVGYRIVRAWREEVVQTVRGGFTAAVRTRFPDFALPRLNQFEHAVSALLLFRPAHLLPPGHASWDALLGDAALRVAARLRAEPGGIAARTWGERNTTRIRHPLSRALPPLLGRWLDMPAQALPGDSHMPRVQGRSFGASERFAVSPGAEQEGYLHMPGGQSGHPLSPFYGAGHADWARGAPTPFLPGPPRHQLRFEPAVR
ncbi:MAG TPA: penicillin acylase family protein [Dokdonella sp.]|uniref:penicillin acylase family protein n=1 Tax=Dokdonella sp. TaxID=2291710 RepID=UPI002C21C72B|nr:penicillin acylase family protein [Dokdonella sp.]HUD41751.1 penicillin acylase family protein [Dokdonella sp.]